MTDTNIIEMLHQLQAAQAAGGSNAVTAWHIVALGVGASIVHAYHTIVAAGGVKAIWRKFWNGAPPGNSSPNT